MNAAVEAHRYVERKRDPARSIHAQVEESNEYYALVRIIDRGNEYFLQFHDGKIFIGDCWIKSDRQFVDLTLNHIGEYDDGSFLCK